MNVRMTTARQLILDELNDSETHLTATKIFENLKDRLPSLNISTVYRSLEYLVKNQLVTVSDIGMGSPVYEPVRSQMHHHLVCLNCKEIMELEDEIVTQFFKGLEKDRDFEILTNHLVLYGHCQACQDPHPTHEGSLK